MLGPLDRALNRWKTAFVFSGGGNLGAIQVGMLGALIEAGIVPDAVFGCSVGAINGAALAADPTSRGVTRLEGLWRELDKAVLMPSGWLPATVGLIRKGESLQSPSALTAVLEDLLGPDARFEDLQLGFSCVATDIDRAREHWFTSGQLVEPILASAALPAVYPAVTIGRSRYTDGGVVNDIPISRAVEMGYGRIYVLHVGNYDRPTSEIRRPLDALVQTYWIARRHRFVADVASVPQRTRLILLPTGNPTSVRYNDFSRTDELIDAARSASRRFLDGSGLGGSGGLDMDSEHPLDGAGTGQDSTAIAPPDAAGPSDAGDELGAETPGERSMRTLLDRWFGRGDDDSGEGPDRSTVAT